MSEEVIIKSRAMENVPFHMAPVDIIIPFHGEHDRVGKLIESIFSTVRTNKYQISLVDDASGNSSFIREFHKVPGVVSFRHDKRKGFGAGINTALSKTKQPYVLVLHSDVVVAGNKWLSNLGTSLLNMRDRGVKMISPKTNNPCGVSRLAGERAPVMKMDDQILGADEWLPLYCALFRRELVKKIGIFKEYPYAGGEAEEYAARMLHYGYRQGVSGGSWVYHEGGVTTRHLKNSPKIRETLVGVEADIASDIKSWKKSPAPVVAEVGA